MNVINTKHIMNPNILVDAKEIKRNNGRMLIHNGMLIVKEQMRIVGIRRATIDCYVFTINKFVKDTGITYIDEITVEVLLEWLSKLGDVSDITKSAIRIQYSINKAFNNKNKEVIQLYKELSYSHNI